MNRPGDGPVAPIIKARNDDDPLGPIKLAQREMTVQQALAELDDLFAVSVDPIDDASYPHIRRRLVALEMDCRAVIAEAQRNLKVSAEIAGLTANFDMKVADNIKVRSDALNNQEADRQALDRLEKTLGDILKALRKRA